MLAKFIWKLYYILPSNFWIFDYLKGSPIIPKIGPMHPKAAKTAPSLLKNTSLSANFEVQMSHFSMKYSTVHWYLFP